MAKYCKDCKFYLPPPQTSGGGYGKDICMHPDNVNLVTGEGGRYDPQLLRSAEVYCGMSGVWWKPKEAEKVEAPAVSLRPQKKQRRKQS